MPLRPAIAALAAALVLSACQSAGGRGRPLTRNLLACKEAGTAAAIARSGTSFQRAVDDALASGACRLFPAGTRVSGGAAGAIVDSATGRAYYPAG